MAVDVAVHGSANLDVVLRVTAIPAPGETVLVSGRERHPGGKGLNQAVAAARAGAATAFVGAVGRDAAGDELLAAMRVAGIDTAEARAVVADSSVLVAQLEVPLTAVSEAAAVARSAGTIVVLNAAPPRYLPESLLSMVDVLVVNEHEALALAGLAQPEEAAVALARPTRDVVVTLGARGAAHVDREGKVARTSGLEADPVDTTGAGDTFVGVLAASLADGVAMPQAVLRAVAAGALQVETRGAVPSIPTREAVTERLRTTCEEPA